MIYFQISLPGLARNFNNLTIEEIDFLEYFGSIDNSCISPVVDAYDRKKGIIVVADSTFLITTGATRGQKDDQGQWQFLDSLILFSTEVMIPKRSILISMSFLESFLSS